MLPEPNATLAAILRPRTPRPLARGMQRGRAGPLAGGAARRPAAVLSYSTHLAQSVFLPLFHSHDPHDLRLMTSSLLAFLVMVLSGRSCRASSSCQAQGSSRQSPSFILFSSQGIRTSCSGISGPSSQGSCSRRGHSCCQAVSVIQLMAGACRAHPLGRSCSGVLRAKHSGSHFLR